MTMEDDAKTESEDDECIIESPLASMASHIQVPSMSAPDFLLNALSINYDILKHKPWVIDAIRGTTVLFSEVEPLSYKLASALTKAGFKKGDWLYFVTYEVALIYVVQMGVWRCGGATRGCFQKELEDQFTRQLLETKAKFVLCDRETAAPVKRAVSRLPWKVQLLSIGDVVTGAISIEEMMYHDDGSQFPHDLIIDPKEDVISVPNTSGSTGCPKGAMHTHANIINFLANMGGPKKLNKSQVSIDALLTMMGNFSVGAFMHTCMSFLFGYTVITISKFNKRTYMGYLMKYKPNSLALYHYVASWLARCEELKKNDVSFVKFIIGGGSVFDYSTMSLICTKLPNIRFFQSYGMSETLVVTTSSTGQLDDVSSKKFDNIGGIKYIKTNDGNDSGIYLSCGILFPQVKAKIVDLDTGHILKRMSCGKLFLQCPYVMKGYLKPNEGKGPISPVDKNGWIDTGDLAFFDNEDNLYIVDRVNHIFKYYMHQVSVVEIEAVISEHPDVLAVGVAAIPNPETTSLARAYIVLKSGKSIKEEDILKYVSGKVVFYKQLHGGATFVNSLPMNSGGKLDRRSLYNMAMAEIKH